MKRKMIATGALAAMMVGGAGLADATAAPAAPSATQQSPGQGLPSEASATAQLKKIVKTDRVAVELDSGSQSGDLMYQAAVITGKKTVAFYQFHDGWGKVVERKIPTVAAGADDRKVAGFQVTGANDPVFVVTGSFTGNSTGQALAFGRGENNVDVNWGLLVGKGKNLVNSGKGLAELGDGPGLELSITVRDGQLVTKSMWGPGYDNANVEQSTNPVVRTWKGTGAGDNLVQTSQHGGPTR